MLARDQVDVEQRLRDNRHDVRRGGGAGLPRRSESVRENDDRPGCDSHRSSNKPLSPSSVGAKSGDRMSGNKDFIKVKALLASVLLALTLQPAPRPDQSVLIEIPATSPWTDTGIVLNAGDRSRFAHGVPSNTTPRRPPLWWARADPGDRMARVNTS